jgi:hypothetical protein
VASGATFFLVGLVIGVRGGQLYGAASPLTSPRLSVSAFYSLGQIVMGRSTHPTFGRTEALAMAIAYFSG